MPGTLTRVNYSLQNALFQWEDGERRLRDAPGDMRRRLDRATELLVEELRRRLGSAFLVRELAALYASGPDWTEDMALAAGAGSHAASVVDAAFGRYAREASDFAGGRPHDRPVRD
jgi:hypothetical protein